MLQVGVPAWILLFSFTFLTAHSQDCDHVLRGLVEDTPGEKLPGATVMLVDSDRGTVTQVDGTFELTHLCAGQYTIRVRYVGYEDQQITVRIPSTRLYIIQLKPAVSVLHDIVIEGSHSRTHALSQSISIVSDAELMPHRGKSLGEMLQNVQGVTNIMSGPGIFKPVIQGLHSQRVLVLNNGLRQEGQQWGVDHAPEIDPFVASEIEVVRGAEAVRYGSEAMGGVIIVNAAPLHYSPGFGGELSAAVASNNRMGAFSGMLEGGLKGRQSLAWRIQGTLKRGGDYHSPDYQLSNTGTREYNASAAIGWKKGSTEASLFMSSFNTSLGILRSAHSGNLNDLQSSIENKKPWYIRDFTYDIENPRQKVGHHLVKAVLESKLENIGNLKVVYGGQFNDREEYDIRRDKQNIPALSLDLFTYSVDVTLDHDKDRWSGTVGLSGIARDNRNKTGIGLLPTYSQYAGGIFIFEKYRKGKWIHEFGARLDHQNLQPRMYQDRVLLEPSYNFTFGSATVGSAVYIGDHSRLSSNLGVSTRAPQVNELFSQGLHHGSAAIEEGLLLKNGVIDPDASSIATERSWKWSTSLQHFRDRFSFELTGYLNYFNNYIYLTPYESRLTIRGYFPVFHYLQTTALLAGGDFSAEVKLTDRWSWSGKASYVMAEDRETSDRLPLIPPAEIENQISYAFPRIGNWKSIEARIFSRTALKQTRAPQTIYPADIAESPVSGTFDFMAPPDGYTLIGIDLTAHLTLGNREFTLNASVDNLLNTAYRNYLNRLRYFADEPGRNFSIRVNYKFHSHD